MRFRVIHISDLHLNTKKSNYDQSEVISALCRDLVEICDRDGMPIDLVAFTGDLVGKGVYSDNYKEVVREMFISPVLKATQLSDDRFIFCPGNHDVELSRRDEIYEAGLRSKLMTKNDINNFIDNQEKNGMAFLDIDKYNEFVSGFGVDARLIKTQLFSAFNFSINNVAVGVATLNSAWRATGRANDEDCGSLLVGERQVELAGAQIKNCNVKIAMMHHPMNWLSARDFQHVQRAVARNFDVLLHGHVHETEGMSLVSPHNNLIVCGAGCLYQSREYFNGYSIIDFDMSGNIFRQEAREYYGARNSFGSTSRFADGGVFESSFKGDASINFTLPESSVERISESINEQLISYSISDVAPDDIDDLFVEPRLSEEAPNELLPAAKGEKSAIDSSNLVSLPEIETQPGNYFIWGVASLERQQY